MKIAAIIQARFGSTRLPGKALLPLGDSTVLGQVVSRARKATRLDSVWVATTTDNTDDVVCAEARRINAPCFRGSADDVLARYRDTALSAQADVIVRITADCPLFDGLLLDRMLETFHNELRQGNHIDYFSNVIVRSFPRGLDAEIFTFSALDRAFREATRTYDREHVTPYFYNNPEFFSLYSYQGPENLARHRWTLDTPDDWTFMQRVYEELSPHGESFATEDILALVERHPDLRLINAHVEQKKDAAARANLP